MITLTDIEKTELRKLHKGITIFEECGKTYFHIPSLKLPDRCNPMEAEVLLCSEERDGYQSRLFFNRVIASPQPLNWNAQGIRIGEKVWHAYSWRTPAGLRPSQMIAAHIKALS